MSAVIHRLPRRASRGHRRRRVLIANLFLDEYRRTSGSPARVPRAMGPPYLAGAFARDLWDIRLYNEQRSGTLADMRLLEGLDMLVLTGITSSLDRMRQVTAYARWLSPGVVVAAGGPPVRALPRLSRAVFDYACLGGIEELHDVIGGAFGPDYAAEEMFPRYDLPYGGGMIGYVESSRNCNFACSFCSLTGEKARYHIYDLDYVRRQIEAVGNRQICFIDNNFYGNDRNYFRAKVELCRELYEAGKIRGWSCLVTGDFFARPENLEMVSEAGCKIIFSGVESFDAETISSYSKRQNRVVPQVKMIRDCLEAGILFSYGVMMDPSHRRISDLHAEIDFILGTPEIALPSFFTLAIPLLGTPYFRECVERDLLFPNTLLRNLDGLTLTMRPLDPLDDAIRFARDLPSLRGHRDKLWRHCVGFARRYRRKLEPLQLFASLVTAGLIMTESFARAPARFERRRVRPTYYGPSQPLDACYRPQIPLPSRYEALFRPVRVTDESGAPHPDVVADLQLEAVSAAVGRQG